MRIYIVLAVLFRMSAELLVCQIPDIPNYFPLSIGNKYIRYESSTAPPLPSQPTVFAGDLVLRDTFNIGGKNYFYFPGLYFGKDTVTAAIGGRVYYHHQGTDQLYYDFTARVGETWQLALPFTSTQSLIFIATLLSKTDTVQVTAGRFTNCLRIKFRAIGTSLEYTDWLAPSVGLVFHGSQIPWELHEALVNGIKYPGLVGINEISRTLDFTLYQNYPNPFNPSTLIQYAVPADGFVSLKVFDVLGKEVITLVSGFKAAGTHQALFDAPTLPSGVYVSRLEFGGGSVNQKMLLVR